MIHVYKMRVYSFLSCKYTELQCRKIKSLDKKLKTFALEI
jgi:hypothetical protein